MFTSCIMRNTETSYYDWYKVKAIINDNGKSYEWRTKGFHFEVEYINTFDEFFKVESLLQNDIHGQIYYGHIDHCKNLIEKDIQKWGAVLF